MTDLKPEAFYDGSSKEPCLMWAYEGYVPGPNDVVLYESDSVVLYESDRVIEQCAQGLERRIRSWRARGSSIFNGQIVADELQFLVNRIRELKAVEKEGLSVWVGLEDLKYVFDAAESVRARGIDSIERVRALIKEAEE